METRNVCNPFSHRRACGHEAGKRSLSAFQRRLGWDRALFRLSRRHCKASRARRSRIARHRPRTEPDRSGGPRMQARINRGGRRMELTIATILVAFAGVFLICFMKGAFGGGFAIVGIPLLSIVMDPVTAGGLLAPLFVAMGSVCTALLETLDLVEAGPCAVATGARDRHRVRLSAVPVPRPPRHRDHDGVDHPDLCRPMACCRRGGDNPSAFDAEGDHCRSRLGNHHHGGSLGWTAACDVSAAPRPSGRTSTRERRACSSPSATRPRRCRGCCW